MLDGVGAGTALGVLALAVVLATGLWWIVFRWQPANFWLLMACSTALLGGITLWLQAFPHPGFRLSDVLWGVASAAALYGVFRGGQAILTAIIPSSAKPVAQVYATKDQCPLWVIALLLLLVIGPGEELFWRGLVQGTLATWWPGWVALTLAAGVYAAVHVVTRNPILVLAALVSGLGWGAIYLLTGSIVAVIVSHALWDASTLVFLPLVVSRTGTA